MNPTLTQNARRLLLSRRIIETYQCSLSSPNPAWPHDVRALVTYLHAHLFDEGLSVQGAKQACGIRDNNSSSRFAYYVGSSIKKYVNLHRIKVAKRLMRDPSLKIVEVALILGFASPGALAMAFQRHEGCSPTDFRRRERKMEKNVMELVKQ